MPNDHNTLYFGDNLSILREQVSSESVDLIYLDPPFNSNANYNVLFAEKSGEKSAAQITAFEDTWHWCIESERTFQEIVLEGPRRIANLMQALRTCLGTNDLMAYLTMMAPRLVELHRVLKPTGSIYLHCDPTASHYIKLMMDAVFEPSGFLNEIVWKRTSAHSSAKRFGPVHDIILYYAKSTNYLWNTVFQRYDDEYIQSRFRNQDNAGRRWKDADLTGAGTRNGETGLPWRGIDVTAKGRHWMYPPTILDELDEKAKIYWPIRGGVPRLKQYLDEMPGVAVSTIWSDISPINSQAQERLGYPTQKPEALLERIIRASSNEGDIILDPFCGCGTAVAVAERLHRRWIGIDITHLAITLMRHRLRDAFGTGLSLYEVVGDPKDVASAETLSRQDRYKFEWWALGLVDARPARDKKKGADAGIDGYINFFEDKSNQVKKIIVQVKSGHVSASQIRDLRGVLEREEAAIAAFVTLKEPTREMIKEAISAGFYEAKHYAGREYPRIQILTIEELLSGKKLLYPRLKEVTFKQAERKDKRRDKQAALF